MTTVKLQYFKRSGKWYSDGEYRSEHKYLWEIVPEVRDMLNKKKLPCLIENHSDYDVLCIVDEVPYLIKGDL